MIRSKKFEQEVKRKFLLLDILGRIEKGETPYDIRKKYGWSRQRLNYWIKQLKNADLIRLKIRSNIAIYELTPEGKNFYTGCVQPFTSGIRLHNIQFTYPVIKEGNLEWEKQWELKGLINKLKKESNATIVLNGNSLSIYISSLIGSNAFELQDKAKNIADGIAEKLKKDFGFELGQGVLVRKPHFTVLNPIFDKISRHLEFSSQTAKIDESEGSGELEFFEPNKVQQFIELPERIEKLENHLIRQTEIMDAFSRQLELHLSVLQEMKETLKAIREVLGK